jgi:putative transposase
MHIQMNMIWVPTWLVKTCQGTASAVPKAAKISRPQPLRLVMAVPTRLIHAPGTYFVTSRTWESQALFINERNAQAFIETLLDYRAAEKYQLHAFVVMPEHIHLLLTPALESSLERAVQLVKGGSSHRIGQMAPRPFPLWQRGFSDHRIRDEEDYVAHVRYLELNPVKRGLLRDAAEYRYSSAHAGFALDPIPQRLKPERFCGGCGMTEVMP